MEKICIEMPVVAACAATECAYNRDSACQARAITIGDGVHAGCDTFWKSEQHAKTSMGVAGIGACKMTGCKFNDGLECVTESIRIGRLLDRVSCTTFSAR